MKELKSKEFSIASRFFHDSKMTSSPHHRLLAPAEQSSETSRTEAAQALSQLQTQQPDIPLSTSSSGYTPLSSNHSFHSLPVTHGSSYSLGNVGPAIPVLPSPTSHWEHAAIRPRSSELALRSVKRNASPTELRSPRSRRDNESLLQLSTIPTPTSDQFKPGTHPHASKRAPSRARASPFVGSKTLSHGRDSQLGKRPPGRPRKSPVHPDDLGTSVGERVEDDGDAVTSTTSPNPRTAALEGAQARFPFHNTFMGSDSPEFRFTGPSLGSQDQVGASLAHNPSVVANPSFFGPRSTYDHPLSHTRSSAAHTPWSPSNPLSSSSSSLSYGSPGVPIPQPPYQILPAPKASASRQDPVHPSVEADGYMILRNAISPALVRDLVVFINTGLPVIAKSETAQTYAAPIQAYKVRDEFVLVCSIGFILTKVLTGSL